MFQPDRAGVARGTTQEFTITAKKSGRFILAGDRVINLCALTQNISVSSWASIAVSIQNVLDLS